MSDELLLALRTAAHDLKNALENMPLQNIRAQEVLECACRSLDVLYDAVEEERKR